MNPRMPVKLPSQLKERILKFAFGPQYKTNFTANDINSTDPWRRRFCNINEKNNSDIELTDLIKQFAKTAYSQIGVDQFVEEHMFGNFIGVNTEGGSVHEHIDPRNIDGYIHVRFNFLVQKPHTGGNPIIDGVEYEIAENQSWINYASEWRHGSTTVSGDRPRVTLSLGAYIHPELVKTITDKINNTTVDYSRIIRPQEDGYDIPVFQEIKKQQGWKQYDYPTTLMRFDKKICMLSPQGSSYMPKVLGYNYTELENLFKQIYPAGYNDVISLVDAIAGHIPQGNQNISGHIVRANEYGYPNIWGIMTTLDPDPAPTIVNLLHELMHWKLVSLGFGTGPNKFFPTTKEFILNEVDELCWSIVNSYADTAQPAVGSKPTNRPVSASLHAYVSFLSVGYTYLQLLKIFPNSEIATYKTKLWGSRYEKCFDELLKVGKFTEKGEQLMKGIGEWTLDFYREYKQL